MHEGAKADIPILRSRDINLVTKYVNEVNEVLKFIPVRNLSEFKHVTRASALLVCEKDGDKADHTINKKEPFWKRRIEEYIAILRNNLSRIDDWFKGRWKNCCTKLKCKLKKKYKIKAKGLNTVLEELKQRISAKTSKLKRYKPRGNNKDKIELLKTTKKPYMKKYMKNKAGAGDAWCRRID